MEERIMAEKQIKTIGVLTSGGDAPGMNAAIRAVVRRGLSRDRKSTRLNSSHTLASRMPSSA